MTIFDNVTNNHTSELASLLDQYMLKLRRIKAIVAQGTFRHGSDIHTVVIAIYAELVYCADALKQAEIPETFTVHALQKKIALCMAAEPGWRYGDIEHMLYHKSYTTEDINNNTDDDEGMLDICAVM